MTKAKDADAKATPEKPTKKLPERLWWLSDAPLFIDQRLVTKFHDAIVWPELENEVRQEEKIRALTIGGSLGGEAVFDLATDGLVSWLVGKLKAQAKVSAEGKIEHTRTDSSGSSGTVVTNAERKLIEVVVEYLTVFPDRIVFVDAPDGRYTNLRGDPIKAKELGTLLQRPPRPLVFLELKPKSPIFPTMAELESGGFRPIYKKLDDRLLAGQNSGIGYSEDVAKRIEYWKVIKAAYDKDSASRSAMQELEAACDGHRIGWIDFRVLFGEKSNSAHLHVVPAGEYHTGVFGYNFVHRGYKYGCRLIGTLKSGNDINVLAIYDN